MSLVSSVLPTLALFPIAWATIITSDEYGTEATPLRRHPRRPCLEMDIGKDHPIKAKPRLLHVLEQAGLNRHEPIGAC